jgi:PKD repeat protein
VYEVGDTAHVSLTCTFYVITPIIGNIVGGSIPVSASSEFPVKSSMTSNGPGGGGPGSPPVAAFTGNGTIAPSSVSGVAPFTVMFRDTSGGAPTSWFWEFPDDMTTSTSRDLPHTFLTAGTYLVKMTASNSIGSDSEWQSITVTNAEDVNFEGAPLSITVGQTVTFTDLSSGTHTNPSWAFGSGEGNGSGATVTHKYDKVGVYEVSLTVTYASGDKTLVKPGYITVGPGGCVVPSFAGTEWDNAQTLWESKGFTGTVSRSNAGNNNFTIDTQSLTADSTVPCNSNILVTRQNGNN